MTRNDVQQLFCLLPIEQVSLAATVEKNKVNLHDKMK
jgi:hypothetical protein